jgi:hypothetical protein
MKKLNIILLVACWGIDIVSSAQERYVVNNWIPPVDIYNETYGQGRGNFYASGDVNGDDTITWEDATMLQDYRNGNYKPDSADTRFLDRADLNYDGIVDESDQSMLDNHLATNPFFYPLWYYPKLDRHGQEEVILKAMRIDDSEVIGDNSPSPGFGYEQFCTQLYINFRGISQDYMDYLEGSGEYRYHPADNGRFNFPVLNVRLIFTDSFGIPVYCSAMNTFVLGENLIEWSSLCNVEPQEIFEDFNRNINIQPGEGTLKGKYLTFYVLGPPENPYTGAFISRHLEYGIKDLIPTFKRVYNLPYVRFIIFKDNTNPTISTTLENGATYQSEAVATISVYDEYLKRSWYSFDEGISQKELSEGVNNIILPGDEGDYRVYIYAGDDFYNEVLEELSITIDKSTSIGIVGGLSYEGLSVFPNPSSGIIKINAIPEETVRIDLWDVVGEPVKSITDIVGREEKEIDLSELEPGIYFIVTKDARENITGVRRIVLM